jgi:hypothetical protein
MVYVEFAGACSMVRECSISLQQGAGACGRVHERVGWQQGAEGYMRVQEGAGGCGRAQVTAGGYMRVQEGAGGSRRVREDASGLKRVREGEVWHRMVQGVQGAAGG